MLVHIINFLFVYAISGLIISFVIRKFSKSTISNELSLLLGYGISPLLISLFVYYLYLIFPGNSWRFYAIVIYAIFSIFFLFSKNQIITLLEYIKNISFDKYFKKYTIIDTSSKILLVFVLFMTVFTISRNVFYNTTYTDAIKYLKQGFVYSYDRSLDRLETKEPFDKFDAENPLYGPEEKYIMAKAIRPAIPVFYSFFYTDNNPNDFIFSSIKFVYSYYFVLLVLLFIYILSQFNKNNILLGLTILLSCYFFTKLSYSNYKEIIIAFFALLSLFILHKTIQKKTAIYAMLLGILCGLMGYINYSGLVIAGLIFLSGIIFFRSTLKIKISLIFITLLFFVIFSGNEVLQYKNFIFQKKLISVKNQEQTFKSNEFRNRLITEKKISDKKTQRTISDQEKETSVSDQKIDTLYILLTKKLQGLTQIQFFGLTFWFFLLIIILGLIKKKRLDFFSKLTLFFIFSFFMVFSDPFFLNPHKYAYVLSIGYRYTALIVPIVAIFIAVNYQFFLEIINKIKIIHLQPIIILSALLLNSVREYSSLIIFEIFKKITIFTNPHEYYLLKINLFLILLAFFSIILFVFILFYRKKFYWKKEFPMTSVLFILILFIFPSLFTLNNNQNVINTFRYSLSNNIPYKLEKVLPNKKEKDAFLAINYINKHVGSDMPVLITTKQFNSIKYNFWLYTANNKRLVSIDSLEEGALPLGESYLLINKSEDKKIKNKCSIEKTFYNTILLKCTNKVVS